MTQIIINAGGEDIENSIGLSKRLACHEGFPTCHEDKMNPCRLIVCIGLVSGFSLHEEYLIKQKQKEKIQEYIKTGSTLQDSILKALLINSTIIKN